MIIDALDQLIYKKISNNKVISKNDDFKIAIRSSNGTIGYTSKKQKNANANETYFLVNATKRWYRLLWGTRERSLQVKGHGEITVMLTNPLRFLHKTDYSSFHVKDLQIFISDEITNHLYNSTELEFDVNKVQAALNEKFETYGLEVTRLDF